GGFAGLGGADDEGSLAAADGAEEVYESAGGGAAWVFEGDAGLWVDAGEVFEGGAVGVGLGGAALDGDEALDDSAGAGSLAAAALFSLADFDGDLEAGAEGVLLADLVGDEGVVFGVDDASAIEAAHASLGRLGPLDDAREGGHVGCRVRPGPASLQWAARREAEVRQSEEGEWPTSSAGGVVR